MVKNIMVALLALYAAALTLFHFANPYPLIQIPDKGHRIYVVPTSQHETFLGLFGAVGYKAFGTFTAGGLRQTLLDDGITVVASMEKQDQGVFVVPKAAMSLPCPLAPKVPGYCAKVAADYLEKHGIGNAGFLPDAKNLGGDLVVVSPKGLGWDIAFRLPGYKMPWPVWEK